MVDGTEPRKSFSPSSDAEKVAALEAKVKSLEDRITVLDGRFRILEDMVPDELRMLSLRIMELGQWSGYDKEQHS